MGNFNKFHDDRGGHGFGGGGRGGGFGGGRGGNSYGGRDDGPRPKFPAVCDKCGQSCEVPFRPTGDRPVYCSNCFKTQGGSDYAPKSFGMPAHAGGGSNFAPKFGSGQARPQPTSGNAGAGISKGQIDLIMSKLDKILSYLAPMKSAPVKVAPVIKAVNEVKPEVKIEKSVEKKEKVAKKAKAKKK